jgi:multiple sugar transport system permease protein
MTLRRRETLLALAFLLPSFVMIGAFLYYPILQTLLYSFFDLQFTTTVTADRFIGLRNYSDVFTDAEFWGSLRFTLYFTGLAVLIEFIIGMGLALASYQVPKSLRWLVRALVVVPWAVPPVVQASMWKWLYNSDVGLFGVVLVDLGLLAEPPQFLTQATLAVHSVIVAHAWKGSSITAIFLMGGLAVISQTLYEAARIDGANGWTRFTRITLPLLTPTILAALLFRTIDALRSFDIVYGLTGGGPGNATEILSAFVYRYYFSFTLFGLGSAYAVVTFVLVMAVSSVYLWRLRANVSFRR